MCGFGTSGPGTRFALPSLEKRQRAEHFLTDTFIILRKEHDSYRSLGPLARAWALEDARDEVASLASRYPQQEFRIFADLGGAVRREIISVNLQSPDIEQRPAASVTPMRRRARAA
jgi:hypothetical protein